MKTKNKIIPDYTPDKWVIVKINPTLYKVLAGWYGGYLNGDEWRISSGITNIVKKRNKYYIYNESGSIYECHKNCEGFSSLTFSIFSKIKRDLKNVPEWIDIDQYFKQVEVNEKVS